MSLLKTNRNYRFLFTASAVTNLGDGISTLAFPWLATLITRDPIMIGLVAAATKLPWLLLSIPAGVITDRFDHRRLMAGADVFRMLTTIVVVALAMTLPPLHGVSAQNATPLIYTLCGAAFLLGSAEVLRDNAAQTILPSIVNKRDLETANGQMWSMEQIANQFVGPPLAGFLIAYAVPLPFVVDAVTFAFAAWAIWQIHLPARPQSKQQTGFVEEMRDGITWIFAHKQILRLAVILGVLNLLTFMSLTILVLFSQEILGLSAIGHGTLLMAGAAGGVAGGLLAPFVARRLGTDRCVKLAAFAFIFPYLAIYFTSSVWVVAAALFIEMLAAMLWNVVTVSLRQRVIPSDLLGRVNSIYRFFAWGMIPIGSIMGGVIVAWGEPELGREIAVRIPYMVCAVGCFGLFIYAMFRLDLRAL